MMKEDQKERETCLVNAKKILCSKSDIQKHGGVEEDFLTSSIPTLNAKYVTSLIELYDEICEFLVESKTSTIDIPSCASWRWQNENDFNTEIKTRCNDSRKQMHILHTEINLYQALWLTSLYLLMASSSSLSVTSKTSILTSRLSKTIRKCQFLVKQLQDIQETMTTTISSQSDEKEASPTMENIDIVFWEKQILNATKNNQLLIDINELNVKSHGSQGDDSSEEGENLLSISKEQLQQEEQELLKMASTEIPRDALRKTQASMNSMKNQTAKSPLLKAKLLSSDIHSLPLTTIVQLNDDGIIRAVQTSKDKVKQQSKFWAITSQSVVKFQIPSNKIQIGDVIDVSTGNLKNLSLEVQDKQSLWSKFVSRFVDSDQLVDVKETQLTLLQLWTFDNVAAASERANKEIVQQLLSFLK